MATDSQRDVDDAIMIAEIVGGVDELVAVRRRDALLVCCPPVGCPECSHCQLRRDQAYCAEHKNPWECVAAAIDASQAAIALYLRAANQISDFDEPDSEHEEDDPERFAWLRRNLYFVGVRTGGLSIDLEAAALLREGWRPRP